jgi:hydroxymethylpyrimidine pyrophosphatase-like HAD family hydrolase
MPYRYRAFAVDYDGTLTDSDAPDRAALAAVDEARRSGRRVVLVTGRIMDELLVVFPAVRRHFDAIVAENGCVLFAGEQAGRRPTPAIVPDLARALQRRKVPVRAGMVLLATQIEHASTVLEEVELLGLELQLIRNRGEMMVLPSGFNKGTGLVEALAELGVDRHNVIALGDAENDHSLFEVCEVGIAVANAVDSLKDDQRRCRACQVCLDFPPDFSVGKRRQLLANGAHAAGQPAVGVRAGVPAS